LASSLRASLSWCVFREWAATHVRIQGAFP
jgi:hypothetical protein